MLVNREPNELKQDDIDARAIGALRDMPGFTALQERWADDFWDAIRDFLGTSTADYALLVKSQGRIARIVEELELLEVLRRLQVQAAQAASAQPERYMAAPVGRRFPWLHDILSRMKRGVGDGKSGGTDGSD